MMKNFLLYEAKIIVIGVSSYSKYITPCITSYMYILREEIESQNLFFSCTAGHTINYY